MKLNLTNTLLTPVTGSSRQAVWPLLPEQQVGTRSLRTPRKKGGRGERTEQHDQYRQHDLHGPLVGGESPRKLILFMITLHIIYIITLIETLHQG